MTVIVLFLLRGCKIARLQSPRAHSFNQNLSLHIIVLVMLNLLGLWIIDCDWLCAKLEYTWNWKQSTLSSVFLEVLIPMSKLNNIHGYMQYYTAMDYFCPHLVFRGHKLQPINAVLLNCMCANHHNNNIDYSLWGLGRIKIDVPAAHPHWYNGLVACLLINGLRFDSHRCLFFENHKHYGIFFLK